MCGEIENLSGRLTKSLSGSDESLSYCRSKITPQMTNPLLRGEELSSGAIDWIFVRT